MFFFDKHRHHTVSLLPLNLPPHSHERCVVVGGAGWQLGEHDTWAKMTNFELALRIPLIVRAPWKARSVGRTTDVLACLPACLRV